jgi:hypothetical protein
MSDPTHQKPDHTPAPGSPGSSADQVDPPIHSLCEADGQALDALLVARAGGADRGPMPAGLGERTDVVSGLLGLLDQDEVADPQADLTARTLSAIRSREQRKRFTEQVQMLAEPRRTLGVDWRQLATAAAVFLIGASLLIPVMARQQADSRRVAGASNMSYAGQAIGSYAVDNEGQMPRGDIRPGTVWWEVGQPQAVNSQYVHSNSAHLYRLVRKGYIKPELLTCPENKYADNHALTRAHLDWTGPRAVSFSYQNQYTPRLLRLEDAPSMPVLADRNPLFEVRDGRIVFNSNTSFDAPSRAHRNTGQNVLSADGTVTWLIRPAVDLLGNDVQDNIWAANGIDTYTGTEFTSERGDSFLVP